MMLLIIIAWILVIANAPWWIWLCYTLHIIGSVFAWLFDSDTLKAIKQFKQGQNENF